MVFIDVHCHLDYFKDEEIVDIVQRARASRSTIIVTNSIVFSSSLKKNISIEKKFTIVKLCLGIYPIEALKLTDKEIDIQISKIRKLSDRIIGIGEVGMDFKEDNENHQRQKKIFQKFIKLSLSLDLPITVHSRKAELDCIEILESMKAKKVLMHYFSGKLKLVDRVIKNSWYLSIPTSVTYSEHFQNVIGRVPIEFLLCETDSPFSHPNKKFPNEPSNVIESYRMIAKIKKLPLKKVEIQIEKNYHKLFG